MLEYFINHDWDALKADLMIRIIVIMLGWGCMITSSFVDLWSGVDCAKALGEKIQSNGLRRTVTKIGDYFRVLIFGLLFDFLGSLLTWYDLPYATMIISLSCVLIEAKSVIENSRRKKSKSAEVIDMAKMIVNATNLEQAKNIIRELNEQKQ